MTVSKKLDEAVVAVMKKIEQGRLTDAAGYIEYELNCMPSNVRERKLPPELISAFVAKLKEEGYE